MTITKGLFFVTSALIFATPAFAGRDETQWIQQQRAAEHLRAAQGLAGPTGPQGKIGPNAHGRSAARNLGHPSERVRP